MDRFKLIIEKKGEVQKYDNYISNEVWLDVGNKLEMVFFDHHQEKELKGWIFMKETDFLNIEHFANICAGAPNSKIALLSV